VISLPSAATFVTTLLPVRSVLLVRRAGSPSWSLVGSMLLSTTSFVAVGVRRWLAVKSLRRLVNPSLGYLPSITPEVNHPCVLLGGVVRLDSVIV
jgi:hypothetical protein